MASNLCPGFLESGSCSDTACRRPHSAFLCELCKRVFPDKNQSIAHFQSRKHAQIVKGVHLWLHCSVCENICRGTHWKEHVKSPNHARKARKKGVDPSINPLAVDNVNNHTFCPTCNTHVHQKEWDAHPQRASHRAKATFEVLSAVLHYSEQDKHGVIVDGQFDFGVVAVDGASVGITATATVTTTVPQLTVRMLSARTTSTTPFSVSTNGTEVASASNIVMTVTARQSYAGVAEDRLTLIFEDVQLGTRFAITKPLRIVVGTDTARSQAQSSAPYKPKRRSERHPEHDIEPGERPPSLNSIRYIVTLPQALLPAPIKDILDFGSLQQRVGRIRAIHLPATLSVNTYSQHFRTLIWTEEHQTTVDLARYDIERATLYRDNTHPSLHFLNVPGLAEKRPSVLVGDSILIRRPDAPEGHWYEGFVHVTRMQDIGLRFGGGFRPIAKVEYHVRFRLNRIPLRRQHQALDTAFAPSRLLFPPAPTPQVPPSSDVVLDFHNGFVEQNDRQKLAVGCIVRMPAGSSPFVLFGPPGTGKTVTIVEAILQVLFLKSDARILACAPSNSAADLIAERLGQRLTPDELFRFYAPSRPQIAVPDAVKRFTYVAPNGHFSVESVDAAKNFRVCVTTCVSASVFFGIGVPRGHYSHIFIDEAGQATEPETMISIKTMADNKTNVILSGDPKQLGPIIRSPVAKELGLEVSYVERLMQMDVLLRTSSSNASAHILFSVVKLTRNFRSHPAILDYPNAKFYNGDLVACGPPAQINVFVNSAILPPAGKKFPVMFISMAGKDDREASSPSFFNQEEISMVEKLIKDIKGDTDMNIGMNLNDEDIGVIAPYHAQVVKIRKMLKDTASGVKVGSVEEFQGQEKPVIIVSTVRSSQEFVKYDLRHTLGFVANPRRFNVAVTRAKALLVVVGDPMVLGLDPLWRAFLNYVHNGGGWTGKPISWDPSLPVDDTGRYDEAVREAAQENMNELVRLMEEFTLGNMSEE
ncbi:RNA helicase [Cylindrobasidium torrendii FP15055 ss-10]|uniref:RNA helicase n=1 Tax=Cylindrobasidium torrendii FP15055 ss-10 TaxID=1314674 RepID=A0A0D7BAQ5_9AGAR|nr:RNA helicase [Cylindrobasidium torrendii FP15055 ss-10]